MRPAAGLRPRYLLQGRSSCFGTELLDQHVNDAANFSFKPRDQTRCVLLGPRGVTHLSLDLITDA